MLGARDVPLVWYLALAGGSSGGTVDTFFFFFFFFFFFAGLGFVAGAYPLVVAFASKFEVGAFVVDGGGVDNGNVSTGGGGGGGRSGSGEGVGGSSFLCNVDLMGRGVLRTSRESDAVCKVVIVVRSEGWKEGGRRGVKDVLFGIVAASSWNFPLNFVYERSLCGGMGGRIGEIAGILSGMSFDGVYD